MKLTGTGKILQNLTGLCYVCSSLGLRQSFFFFFFFIVLHPVPLLLAVLGPIILIF